jgi:hypothetical protein
MVGAGEITVTFGANMTIDVKNIPQNFNDNELNS